jgi:hypothetical protein
MLLLQKEWTPIATNNKVVRSNWKKELQKFNLHCALSQFRRQSHERKVSIQGDYRIEVGNSLDISRKIHDATGITQSFMKVMMQSISKEGVTKRLESPNLIWQGLIQAFSNGISRESHDAIGITQSFHEVMIQSITVGWDVDPIRWKSPVKFMMQLESPNFLMKVHGPSDFQR